MCMETPPAVTDTDRPDALPSPADPAGGPSATGGPSPPPVRGPIAGLWTLLPVTAGLAVLACCVLIPQIDHNRRLLFQRQALRQHLEYLDQQIHINDGFLERVGRDPVLTDRLAQRYLKLIRENCSVLRLDEPRRPGDMSPFALVNVPPPPPAPTYQPVAWPLAEHIRNPRTRLWLMCGGLMLLGAGIVLGTARP